jgi:hypothetical protein
MSDYDVVRESVMRLHLAAHLESADADTERDTAVAALSRIEAENARLRGIVDRFMSADPSNAELKELFVEEHNRASRIQAENERLREALEQAANELGEPDESYAESVAANERLREWLRLHEENEAALRSENARRYPPVEDCMDPRTCCIHGPEDQEEG